MSRLLHFWIPEPQQFPSGGNVYNAQIMQALQGLGHQISHSPMLPKALASDSLLIVDTLMLPQMDQWQGDAPAILLVHHLRSMELSDAKEKQRQIAVEAKELAAFDALWGTSEFTAQYLKNSLGLTQAIFQVPPALDLPQGQDKQLRPRPREVIVVANWIPRKGILALLRAWRQQTWPADLRLKLIGNAELAPEYAQLCWAEIKAYQETTGNTIEVCHDLSRPEMLKAYQAADLLISAATMETFGMAIQEALALGLPVLLVAGAYAARYVEEGKNGYCYPQVEALLAGLVALLAEPKVWQDLQAGAWERSGVLARPWSVAGQELVEALEVLNL